MVNCTGVSNGRIAFWGEIDRQHILPSGAAMTLVRVRAQSSPVAGAIAGLIRDQETVEIPSTGSAVINPVG
jgi:hypothetical protein